MNDNIISEVEIAVDINCDDCGDALDYSIFGTTIEVCPCVSCQLNEYDRGVSDTKEEEE